MYSVVCHSLPVMYFHPLSTFVRGSNYHRPVQVFSSLLLSSLLIIAFQADNLVHLKLHISLSTFINSSNVPVLQCFYVLGMDGTHG